MPFRTRLQHLRQELTRQGLDGFIISRADEHLGEYIPASANRLAWMTGFTGSAGVAVVLADRAAVFSDGRYVLQLASQTDPALWERLHMVNEPAPDWLRTNAGKQARIGYDPLLISADGLAQFARANVTLVPVEQNPVDAIWADRPPAPVTPAIIQPDSFAGRSSAQKRADIAAALKAAEQDAVMITDSASVCWLLNIRGADVPYNPFVLSFAVVHADAHVDLICDPAKISPDVAAHIGNHVALTPRTHLNAVLDRLAGRTVRVDAAGSPLWFSQYLEKAGATVVAGQDPCALPRACKNEVECQGARTAHERDAVAMARLLHWVDANVGTGTLTEMSVAAQLHAFRAEAPEFRGPSFETISGAGPNGAIIHYRTSPETNRTLGRNETYLLDSGGQYPDGTTDITRTIWTGPDTAPAHIRDHFTRVLKGHIALATLVFPQGVAGSHIDALARASLWQVGLDFDHGTGHGVGSYLSVHEGPARIARAAAPVPLAEGMILSNEPGYYLPGQYGIRLENLLLVQPSELGPKTRPFLRFETITLAPFDQRLIDADMLTAAERAWLDDYHDYVLETVGPQLSADVRSWLEHACRPLGA